MNNKSTLDDLFTDTYLVLEKNVAICELLHAHARGETDLSEDQLANVVTGVSIETKAVARRMAVRRDDVRARAGWVDQ